MANAGCDDTDLGLYGKFVVERCDGRSEPGEKHHGCAYFVLDLSHDPFAEAALLAYADACEETHPALAADLRKAPYLRREFIGNRSLAPREERHGD